MVFIDSGYATDEVYDICREFPDVTRAIKGQDRISGAPLKTTTIDKYPNGRAMRGGLMLWHVDTNFFKDDEPEEVEEKEEEKEPETLMIGDEEYKQEDLQRLVGLGKIGQEAEEKYNVKLDKVDT